MTRRQSAGSGAAAPSPAAAGSSPAGPTRRSSARGAAGLLSPPGSSGLPPPHTSRHDPYHASGSLLESPAVAFGVAGTPATAASGAAPSPSDAMNLQTPLDPTRGAATGGKSLNSAGTGTSSGKRSRGSSRRFNFQMAGQPQGGHPTSSPGGTLPAATPSYGLHTSGVSMSPHMPLSTPMFGELDTMSPNA
jgi:hypothetical protein